MNTDVVFAITALLLQVVTIHVGAEEECPPCTDENLRRAYRRHLISVNLKKKELCDAPVPTLVLVENLDSAIRVRPKKIVINRCGAHEGCCDNDEEYCALQQERVFKTMKLSINAKKSYKQWMFIQDVKCGCKNATDLHQHTTSPTTQVTI